jgi:ribosomal protein L16 Arg81 hydroxylase
VALIAPIEIQDFIAVHWGKEFVHIEGEETKFVELFPWDQLNQILQERSLPPSRLRLYMTGKLLSPSSYQDPSNFRVRTGDLLSALSRGATLILDHAEETYERLGNLVRSLEQALRTEVHANLYAAWCAQEGFNLHFDEQDTLILQIAGPKQWTIWRPTREYPIKACADPTKPPEGQPFWKGVLRPGHLLHIPRGWWHVVRALNEPALHLTITVRPPCGVDLISWLANRMAASEIARMNMPILADIDQQRMYLDNLRREFLKLWNDDLIQQYIDAKATENERKHIGGRLALPSLTSTDKSYHSS